MKTIRWYILVEKYIIRVMRHYVKYFDVFSKK